MDFAVALKGEAPSVEEEANKVHSSGIELCHTFSLLLL